MSILSDSHLQTSRDQSDKTPLKTKLIKRSNTKVARLMIKFKRQVFNNFLQLTVSPSYNLSQSKPSITCMFRISYPSTSNKLRLSSNIPNLRIRFKISLQMIFSMISNFFKKDSN